MAKDRFPILHNQPDQSFSTSNVFNFNFAKTFRLSAESVQCLYNKIYLRFQFYDKITVEKLWR